MKADVNQIFEAIKGANKIALKDGPRLYFRRQDSLKIFGISPRTLEDLALVKQGPPFFKRGKVCIYHVETFEKWLTQYPVLTLIVMFFPLLFFC